MDQVNVDEIEFFGFLPVSFTNELQEELQECLNDIAQHYHIHHKIQSYISDAFKKNIFIFSNFVLRNILKFPANFKLERKVTDKTIQEDIPALLREIHEKQTRIITIKGQLAELKQKISIQNERCNGYKKLLENKARFYDMCTGAREINSFLKENNDLLEKYQSIGKKRECEFEKLMEYKNIKSEYYRSERDKLLDVADFDILENMNKMI